MAGISNSVDRFNGVVADRAIKVPCIVATSVDITLEGIQTIDSVLVASGDRVLVRAQTNAVENGIYDVKDVAWQRAADWDGNRDIGQGTLVGAYDSVGLLSLYEVTTVDPIVIGSTAVAIEFYIAGAGAALEAGTITNAMLRWDGVDTYRETARIRATADGANFQVYEVTETNFLDVSYVGTSAIFVLSNAAHNFEFQNDVNVSAGDLYLGQVMYIDEQNVASGSTLGQGQLWVRDDDPNVLVYTDDLGTDFDIGGTGAGTLQQTLDLGNTTTTAIEMNGASLNWVDDGATARTILTHIPGAAGDPLWAEVQLLATFDGADGATAYTEESTNGQSGTFVDNAELDTGDFLFGTAAVLLDGSGDYVTFPDNSGFHINNDDFQLEGFINFASLPIAGEEWCVASQWLEGTAADESIALSVVHNAGSLKIRGHVDGNFEQADLGFTPTLGVWYHIAMTGRFAGGNGEMGLYFNGSERFYAAFTIAYPVTDSSETFKIGTRSPTVGGDEAYFHGSIDEVRFTVGTARIANSPTYTIPAAAFPMGPGIEKMQFGYFGIETEVLAETRFNRPLTLDELAAANSPTAGRGQFWVKDDAPNIPMFTDDDGIDFELLGGGGSGGVGSIQWTYDGGAGGNPGADNFRNAPASLTITAAFYFSDTDLDGLDVQNILNTIPVGGHIVMRKVDDNSQFRVYGIISITDNAGWYQVNVDYLFGNGDTTNLTVGDEVTIEFFTSGYVEPGVEVANLSDILYWDGGSTSWQASGAAMRVNPSSPPLGGRLAFLGTAGFNTSSPTIMNAVGAVSACLQFTYGTSNTNGFYQRFEPSGLDRINYGVRLASVNTDVLTFNLDHEIRVEAGATFLIGEKGAAGTAVAAYGQIWVDTAVAPAQQLWFTDDVGGDFPISQPTVLWNAGNQKIQAGASLTSFESSNGNDPTTGAAQDVRLRLQNTGAAPLAEIGFNSLALLAIESFVHGGGIEIRAEDGSGVVQEAMVFDPDGVTSIRGVTNVEILSNETQSAIICTDSLDVGLYFNNAEALRTADRTAADMISGGEIQDAEGTFLPIGVGVIIDDATNWGNGTITPFQQANATQGIIHDDATATLMNTYASTGTDQTNIPNGTQWEVWNDGAGVLTIGNGTAVVLDWYAGDGSTPATGTRTIARGSIVMVRKISDTLYRIWGNGIT